MRDEARRGVRRLGRGQSIDSVAAERAAARDLHAEFQAHVDAARRLSAEPAVISPTATGDAQTTGVRREASRIGFADPAAAAYHARKHGGELPDSEQTSDVVTGFYASARRTIQEGDLVAQQRVEQGRSKLVFHRAAQVGQRRETMMEAVVYVRPSGRVVLATYGTMKEARRQ